MAIFLRFFTRTTKKSLANLSLFSTGTAIKKSGRNDCREKNVKNLKKTLQLPERHDIMFKRVCGPMGFAMCRAIFFCPPSVDAGGGPRCLPQRRGNFRGAGPILNWANHLAGALRLPRGSQCPGFSCGGAETPGNV
jgi:hypothetical protein